MNGRHSTVAAIIVIISISLHIFSLSVFGHIYVIVLLYDIFNAHMSYTHTQHIITYYIVYIYSYN